MPRFSFSSPSGGSNKQSRKERLEQAKRAAEAEKSRRRNFGFLKTGEKRMSSVSLNRTREHAKQLAMVYSDPVGTPTSANSGQGLLNFGDKTDETFDPFNTNASVAPISNGFADFSAKKQTVTNARSGSLLDQHFHSSPTPEREPTASTQDSFDTESVGSAFDMDFLSSPRQTNSFVSPAPSTSKRSGRRKNGPSLDQFVENTKSPQQGPGSYGGASFDRSALGQERSVISMPTFPSNSSMQASFTRQESTAPSSTSASGAAARRRMRNQVRQSGNASVNSSFDDASSYASTSTPPESSPTVSRNAVGNPARNKLAAFQRAQSESFHSQASSGNNSQQSNSQQSGSDSNMNLFDPQNLDGGFTFDAFGLDESQVERDVNQAMKELAGQGMGFSAFFNGDSDGEFSAQNWDSPSNSRRSSPAPSDSEQEGFVDGFRVTQAAPTRNAYPTSSPVSSERSFSSPASRRVVRSQTKGATTPPRWENAPSTSRARKIPARDLFGEPVSNPWKADPWGSGDEDRFSDTGTNSDFDGTKSEILTPSIQAQPRYSTTVSDSKSDVGVLTAYQKSVSFHQDVRLPSVEPSPRNFNDADSDEESDVMKEDLAQEFAQEFVDQASPRHEQQHDYGESSRSQYDQREKYSAPKQQTLHSDYRPGQEKMFQAEFGTESAASDYSEGQSDIGAYGASSSYPYGQHQQSPQNRYHESQDQQQQPQHSAHGHEESTYDQSGGQEYGQSPSHSSSSHRDMNQEKETNPSRFSNFRSKYKAKRASPTPDDSASTNTGDQVAVDQYDHSYDHGNVRNPYTAAQGRFGQQAQNEGSERDRSTSNAPNTHSDHGPQLGISVASTYNNYDNARAEALEEQAPSENSEEKKDEDVSSSKPSADLKAKWQQWESTSTANVMPPPATVPKSKWVNQEQKHSEIAEVELLTPVVVEEGRQEMLKSRVGELRRSSHDATSPADLRKSASFDRKYHASSERANECQDERTSFAGLRSRLTPSSSREETKAKSDAGTGYRSSMASDVIDRLRRVSPRGGAISDTRSDTGSSPSFPTGPSLGKTGAVNVLGPEDDHMEFPVTDYQSPQSSSKSVSYRERQLPNRHSNQDSRPSDQPYTPVERKLTYRERRELELRREQEEKAKVEAVKQKDAPKVDVASLIRKRIAANKQKGAASSTAGSPTNEVPQFRANLKPSASGEKSPQQSLQSPLYGSQPPLSSPSNAFRQPSHSPRLQTSQPSPGAYSYNAPSTIVTGNIEGEGAGSGLLGVLSPASAGTNLTYSADNSQSVNERFAKPQPLPESQPSPRRNTASRAPSDERESTAAASNRLEQMFAQRGGVFTPTTKTTPPKPTPPPALFPPVNKPAFQLDFENVGKGDVKAMLSGFLGARNNPLALIPAPKKEDDAESLRYAKKIEENSPEKKDREDNIPLPPVTAMNGTRPALKNDPKYERYFRMLKVGMPIEVVKHAMEKDGTDPSILDGDHNRPVGLALKEDPKYTKYFKMLKLGIPMPQVKHAMDHDGVFPDVMDQDHNLPAAACEQRSKNEPKSKDTHRRARLHWKTLQKVTRNSLWSKIEKEPAVTGIDFDEDEFKELFQADITAAMNAPKNAGAAKKRGAAVRVIDAKRANNGGIILARVKMSHDEMADAVDRIDGDTLTSEQIENIIEFLPTKEERTQLEKYMLEGGQDAAEKFDGLCECEKFMVSMMTVKHAKRKVRALLFKLQFINCLRSIAEDAGVIEDASEQLKNSTRLRQLLGIVLQFGNRLNTAGKASKTKAGAFTLDSLLKLSQAKAFDKKTTFLHYVVMIVHRNNEILLNFTDDIPTVMKADKVYWDQCLQDLEEVENQLENVRRISLLEARMKKQYRLNSQNQDDDDSLGDIELSLEEEVEALRATPTGLFTLSAIKQVSALRDKVEATRTKFVRVLEYFGEDVDSMQPHELFNIFCVFGRDFNKAKDEAFASIKKKRREERKKAGRAPTPNAKHGKPPSVPERKTLRASSLQPNMSKVIKDLTGQPIRETAPQPGISPQRSQPGYGVTISDPNRDGHLKREITSQQRLPTQRPQYGYNSQSFDQNGERSSNRALSTVSSSRQSEYKQPTSMQSTQLSLNRPPDVLRRDFSSRPAITEVPLPRGMQEAGRFEEVAAPVESEYIPSPTTARDSSTADSMRQKARNRRQRQMEIATRQKTPVSTNTVVMGNISGNQTIESRSPRSSPSVSEDGSGGAPQPGAAASLASRNAMRHRRLQAMKRVSATKKNGSSHSRTTEWPESPDVPTS